MRAFCKYCKSSLTAHHKDLVTHAKSVKHQNHVDMEKSAKMCDRLPFKAVMSNAKKEAELKLSVFIAEHRSLQSVVVNMGHLCELLPLLDDKPLVLGRLKMHRTKCTVLIKNVVPIAIMELIQDIGDSPYSAIVDESTDASTVKLLCIMLKYFSLKRRRIVTTFYRIVQLNASDAESTANEFMTQLRNDGLNVDNLVGIGVDNANVMTGCNHSFTTILKKHYPNLVIIPCICHSLHLCAEKACELLPRKLEFLAREAHSWFSYSSKRSNEYLQLYATMNNNAAPKKIRTLSTTRLTRNEAVRTILEQWEELLLLFCLAKDQDRCFTVEQLHDIMKCNAFKLYMIFLKNTLEDICAINKLFQADHVEPLKLLEDLFTFYKCLLRKIVIPAHLSKITEQMLLDFRFEDHIMPVQGMEFGYEFNEAAMDVSPNEVLDVKTRW